VSELPDMKVGDRVHVKGFSYVGPIVEVDGSRYLGDCGTCRMWLALRDLEPPDAADRQQRNRVGQICGNPRCWCHTSTAERSATTK
jgi:hypothetical protein